MENIGKTDNRGLLKPQLFCLTIPQVEDGADIIATIRWSEKLHYDNRGFLVDIPFWFPCYVNPLPKVYTKREKLIGREVLLQGTGHPLKEKSRHGEQLSFLHGAIVESWSSKDFTFSYRSIENSILGWFRKASGTIVANISIDATKHPDEFEVDS